LPHVGAATVTSPEHALHAIEIIEAVSRSAETGRVQELRSSIGR
jgi:hypothetical protein